MREIRKQLYFFLVILLVSVCSLTNFSAFPVIAPWIQDTNKLDDSNATFICHFDETSGSTTYDKVNNVAGVFTNGVTSTINRSSSFQSVFNKSIGVNDEDGYYSFINFTHHNAQNLAKNSSIEFFIKPNEFHSTSTWNIFGKDYNPDGKGYQIFIQNYANKTARIKASFSDDYEQEYYVYSKPLITFETWSYVVVTVNWSSSLFGTLGDVNIGKIYINASESTGAQSNSSYNGDPSTTDPFYVFSYDGTWNWNGSIDVIKLNNKTFSESEIENRFYRYKEYAGWYYIPENIVTDPYEIPNVSSINETTVEGYGFFGFTGATGSTVFLVIGGFVVLVIVLRYWAKSRQKNVSVVVKLKE